MAYKQRWAYFFEKMADKDTGIVDFMDPAFPRDSYSKLLQLPPDSPEIQNCVVAYRRFWQGFIRQFDPNNKDLKISLSQMLAGVEKSYVGLSHDDLPWWFKENVKQVFYATDPSGVVSFEQLLYLTKSVYPDLNEQEFRTAYDWACKHSSTGKYDVHAYAYCILTWATSPHPAPEACILVPFISKMYKV